jgi:hypothetical protein
MGKVVTQFYSLPDELMAFAKFCQQKFHFRMVVMSNGLSLDAFELACVENLDDSPIEARRINTIVLGFDRPLTNVKDWFDFIGKNPEYLSVTIGELRDAGLEESSIMGKTEDAALLSTWKKVIREHRKLTRSGLWGINTFKGTKHFHKGIRYTQGAAEISAKGVPLLSLAPAQLFSVEEPA